VAIIAHSTPTDVLCQPTKRGSRKIMTQEVIRHAIAMSMAYATSHGESFERFMPHTIAS